VTKRQLKDKRRENYCIRQVWQIAINIYQLINTCIYRESNLAPREV
jgi:hypothetical protein